MATYTYDKAGQLMRIARGIATLPFECLRQLERVDIMTLLAAFLIFSATQFTGAQARSGNSSNPCRMESLPADVQNRLRDGYTSWKIQKPADLGPHAHEAWESEKPLECPGIAVGHFVSAMAPSYAILLVPRGRPDGGYRFLVFTQKEGQPTYEPTVLDKLDQNGAANYFIRGVPISKFFDEPSRKKFQAYTADGILLEDSGENEYEVDVYYWSDGRFRHAPVDY